MTGLLSIGIWGNAQVFVLPTSLVRQSARAAARDDGPRPKARAQSAAGAGLNGEGRPTRDDVASGREGHSDRERFRTAHAGGSAADSGRDLVWGDSD